jgi:hypothetical protein
MSSALYAMRLMWLGGRGDMTCGRVHIDLARPPAVLATLGVVEIQFTPEVRVAIVREMAEPWRDMTSAERGAVCDWLAGNAALVLAALDNNL